MNSQWTEEADYIVVGSGAAGATVAVDLAEAGHSILVLEEGGWYTRKDFTEDVFGSMATLFRDFGAQVAQGRSIMPVLEGCAVGGSTVMNGAIIHRLPEEVHAEWSGNDDKFAKAIPYAELLEYSEQIEGELSVKRNLESILPGLPVAEALQTLGWDFSAMNRNAPGCEFTGRCLQGCPSGGKWSMERTYIPRAMRAGARIIERTKVDRILFERNRAVGIASAKKLYRAKKGVVVAAGVMHTPQLLWRSGLKGISRHLGKHFQSHLGVGMVAIMKRKVRELEGPPQGIEINAFRKSGIKLATQLVPPELLLSRTPIAGQELTDLLSQSEYISSWTASIRAQAEGTLTKGWGGAKLAFDPTATDLSRARESLFHLAELMFEMGAERVFPGIMGPQGFPIEMRKAEDAKQLLEVPLDARYFVISMGHLFGTCRMGKGPESSVVDHGFRPHATQGLHVVDASVFPSNLGVNPQHSVMSMARAGARRILGAA